MLATDIKTVRDNPKLKLVKAVSLGYAGLMINLDSGPKANNPLGKDARVRQAFELSIDREALNQVVFNGEFVPGNQWVSPQNPYYQEKFPIPKRDVAKAKALLKEAGVTAPLSLDFLVPNGPETAPSPRSCSRWRPRRASISRSASPSSRPRSSRSRTANTSSTCSAGAAAPIPTATPTSSRPARRRSTTATTAIPRSTRAPGGAPHQRPGRPQGGVREDRHQGAARGRLFLYLWHAQVLIARSDRLDGFTQMPDGLVRVVGLKLK